MNSRLSEVCVTIGPRCVTTDSGENRNSESSLSDSAICVTDTPRSVRRCVHVAYPRAGIGVSARGRATPPHPGWSA